LPWIDFSLSQKQKLCVINPCSFSSRSLLEGGVPVWPRAEKFPSVHILRTLFLKKPIKAQTFHFHMP
jgi:hypothetical protein